MPKSGDAEINRVTRIEFQPVRNAAKSGGRRPNKFALIKNPCVYLHAMTQQSVLYSQANNWKSRCAHVTVAPELIKITVFVNGIPIVFIKLINAGGQTLPIL